MNESLLNEKITVLKRDLSYKDSEIAVLKSKLDKISKEKDDLDVKIGEFENASQSLEKLIGSQITNNSKSGLGYVSYNAVPTPHTGRFSPLRIEFSHTGLPEFAEPSIKSYRVKLIKVVTKKSSVKIFAPVRENNGAPLIEDWESEGKDEVESPPEKERQTVASSADKVEVGIPKQNVQLARRPVKYAEMYRTQRLRGNQRNWNNLKSHPSGKDNITLQELMVLCTTLSKKSGELGDRLNADQVKYSDAYTKLIKKVKKMEQTVKSSKASEMTKELLQKIYMQAERLRR
uniref:Uncharacterized protein n=1 Tax=Tanacetum cinerariifolium TaxID=118510 RepID=A0A6L2MQD8_TANCI|nr:hypothetical protein [Tanacetum cinerariifolium]